MELNRDFSEFIECCIAREVRFLVVGGYAVAAHGHPRFTRGLDIWVWVDSSNARALIGALDDFGFGSLGLTEDDFTRPGAVVQLGHPPKRIDLLTSIDGVEFDTCWPSRMEIAVGDVTMPIIDLDVERHRPDPEILAACSDLRALHILAFMIRFRGEQGEGAAYDEMITNMLPLLPDTRGVA